MSQPKLRMLSPIFLALLSTATAGIARAAYVSPNHPGILHSEYAENYCAGDQASFGRYGVDFFGNSMSPGTRLSFATDAIEVRMIIEYFEPCTGPECGTFRLELDGELQPQPIGDGSSMGVQTRILFAQEEPTLRELSILWPFDRRANVLGFELTGGSEALAAHPPSRPGFRYVAYGNSITHGYSAPTIAETYPARVGNLRNWSTINMGFAGQIVVPADGAAVGRVGGDLVTVAIGTNDLWAAPSELDFTGRYTDFLANLRAVQPEVPVYCLTPTWVWYETFEVGGRRLEDYRQYIRNVVQVQQLSDPNLYLLEGPDLVPAGLDYFVDGLHPNALGFQHYAQNLATLNLVRNWGFETGHPAWFDGGNSEEVQSPTHTGIGALRIGPGAGGRGQFIGGLNPSTDYAFSAWSRRSSVAEESWIGVNFYDAAFALVATHGIPLPPAGWEHAALRLRSPESFAWCTIWVWKFSGDTDLVVDDFQLSEVGPSRAFLEFGNLVPGEVVHVRLRGGLPNAATQLLYGLEGVGSNPWPALDTPTDLRGPRSAAPVIPTDAAGEAQWQIRVPPHTTGLDVHVQAVQAGLRSSLRIRRIR